MTFAPLARTEQLNFLQDVFTMLRQYDRVAVVVPNNVLFEGSARENGRELLKQADVHTATADHRIFYVQDVKTNILFFDRKPATCNKVDEEALELRALRTISISRRLGEVIRKPVS